MRYAALLGILGIVFVVAAVRSALGLTVGSVGGIWLLSWGLTAALGYLALCLLTMALVYAWSDRGHVCPWGSGWSAGKWALGLLLLPYRIFAWVVLRISCRFDSMEPLNAVGPRLYVGRYPLASERAGLAELGVNSVLSLCAEFPRKVSQGATEAIETGYLPILDGTAPSDRQFGLAVDWIAARHRAGRSVLVHCAQGRGRSVVVAAAALCRLGLAASPDDALARIVVHRPKARPSRKQRAALARFWTLDQRNVLNKNGPNTQEGRGDLRTREG